jgi:hypothetical protein
MQGDEIFHRCTRLNSCGRIRQKRARPVEESSETLISNSAGVKMPVGKLLWRTFFSIRPSAETSQCSIDLSVATCATRKCAFQRVENTPMHGRYGFTYLSLVLDPVELYRISATRPKDYAVEQTDSWRSRKAARWISSATMVSVSKMASRLHPPPWSVVMTESSQLGHSRGTRRKERAQSYYYFVSDPKRLDPVAGPMHTATASLRKTTRSPGLAKCVESPG